MDKKGNSTALTQQLSSVWFPDWRGWHVAPHSATNSLYWATYSSSSPTVTLSSQFGRISHDNCLIFDHSICKRRSPAASQPIRIRANSNRCSAPFAIQNANLVILRPMITIKRSGRPKRDQSTSIFKLSIRIDSIELSRVEFSSVESNPIELNWINPWKLWP